jgi:indoleamine 2,3-dioxygenase
VSIVSHSHKLIEHTNNILEFIEQNDRTGFNEEMIKLNKTMELMTGKMKHMWRVSNPNHFDSFRVFLMGIKNSPLFPKGVIYRGVDPNPRYYRGSTAANDSIIPTLDNLLEVTGQLPENALTESLREFRIYRP